MYASPKNSRAVPTLTLIVVAFIVIYAVMALAATRVELRCGAACQQIVNHGREW